MNNTRTPLAITFSVWKALFLREAVFRLSTGRASWLWLLLQPASIIIIFVVFVSAEMLLTTIGGIGITVWIFAGQGGFYMYQHTSTQTMHAVKANQTLFAYRQVKPVDTVLVRAVLEGILMFMILIILGIGIGLFYGVNVIPDDPLLVLAALCGFWLLGLGFGLIISVLDVVVPEIGILAGMTSFPLHILSGVLFNISIVPHPYYDWFLFNPLLHCLQAIRLGFSSQYQVIPEFSMSYIFEFALVLIFFGLVLHKRFVTRLVEQ